MHLLFRILYAAHASGTHHKLALDALRFLSHPAGERWQRLTLANAKLYLEGSKAPDTEFKDFKNHVLHVGDAYWGGAPEKAQHWYGHALEAIAQADWPRAVYATGVLSHYFTDPLHPFHTAQSEAENTIHRAVEWSISRSYDTLYALGETRAADLSVAAPAGEDWLRALVCEGAEVANESYEKLIAHYDFHRGVAVPQEGLDEIARLLIARLIRRAAVGFGAVIDRLLAEAKAEPPEVSLTLATVVAGLQMPAKWIGKRLADAEDRRQVEAMYDELTTTGKVERTLPDDDRMVRDLHAREVAAPRRAKQLELRAERLRKVPRPAEALSSVERARRAAGPAAGAPEAEADEAKSEPRAGASVPEVKRPGLVAAAAAPPVAPEAVKPQPKVAAEPLPEPAPAAEPVSSAPAPAPRGSVPSVGVKDRSATPRYRLAPEDAIEAAPSIGERTAERLTSAGIATVAELIAADPVDLAPRLSHPQITAGVVKAWQRQARLVCTVPGLRGTDAQLLVAAGVFDLESIATAEPEALTGKVAKIAATPDGQRLLRDMPVPDAVRVSAWIAAANAARLGPPRDLSPRPELRSAGRAEG